MSGISDGADARRETGDQVSGEEESRDIGVWKEGVLRKEVSEGGEGGRLGRGASVTEVG